MCQILDGPDDLSVVPRHQHKITIYLELMREAALEQYSQPRSDSSQRTQNPTRRRIARSCRQAAPKFPILFSSD